MKHKYRCVETQAFNKLNSKKTNQ